MKNLLVITFLFTLTTLFAQSETIAIKGGTLSITPVLHSAFVMQFKNKTVYVDPYGGAQLFSKFPAPDLVIITDIHGDHLDKATLGGLNLSKTRLIAPKAVADQLDTIAFKKVTVLGNGETTKWKSVALEALAMYNLPEAENAPHPKGRGNGYVLTVGGKRIYISGDTEDIPEMRQLKNIDAAFVCMNLPYTMDINQAADAVLEFKPKVVYPFHYRGSEGFSDVEQFKKMVNEKDASIEVRLLKWYPTN